MKVRDIMTQPPQTCHASTSLATASRRMKDNATGMLVVLDGRGRVTGVVTDRDIALTLSGPNQDVAHLCVDSAMSRRAHTCREDDDLHAVLARMARTGVRRLPVISSDGDLSAVISIDDIILWAVEQGGVTPRELATALRKIFAPHTRRARSSTSPSS
jgi:CBS domain-containing protein